MTVVVFSLCQLLIFLKRWWYLFHSETEEINILPLIGKKKKEEDNYTRVLHAKSPRSCFYDPMNYSPPGSSVHAILQSGILECVAMPFSRRPSHLGMVPMSLTSLALSDGFLTTSATWEAQDNSTFPLNNKFFQTVFLWPVSGSWS